MSEATIRHVDPKPTCTEAELAIVKATAELWNAFLKLPKLGTDDINDVRFHIHALQAIAAATFVARTSPNLFICEGSRP